MSHYFKLENSSAQSDFLPQEGVMAIDINDSTLKTEMRGLDAPNEKFYLASTQGQILFLATPDEQT